jgi:hypothetical protein
MSRGAIVVLYECLIRRCPHEGTFPWEVMDSITAGRFVTTGVLRLGVPPPLEQIAFSFHVV